MKIIWLLLCSFCCFSLLNSKTAYGQLTLDNSEGKSLVIPRLDGAANIDGVLDDEIWSRAILIEDLHQVEPVEYAEPTQRTQVWAYYDDNALYFAARIWETDTEVISANILRQGQGLQSDDLFAVILDPYLDRRNGFRFEVNANGVRWEGQFLNVTSVDGSWDGIWQADASRDDQGWFGEMRIPFQTLSFDPNSDSWGINFRRAIRRNNESIAWSSRNRQVDPSTAGTVSGLTGMRQGMGLDIVPSVTAVQQRTFGPLGESVQNFEPSVDIFYKITPQLNAALTINTDFSAAEVDSRQVNLTRFSLFFPERRDFFIRDADVFEFGKIGTGGFSNGGGNPAIPGAASQNARPFFSRRIGLSTSGTPVDIKVGGKLSGKVGNWNVGSLFINQDKDDATGLDAQNIFVGRAVLNVQAESQLGIMLTDGDPQSNLSSSLIGVDYRYRNSQLSGGKTLEGVVFYQQTDTEGKSGSDASYGFSLGYPNNQGWRGRYGYKRVEKNFDPAVGFVNRTDVQDHAIDLGYRHFFTPGGFMRSLYGGFDGYRAETLTDGNVSSQNYGLRVTANNNSGDGMFGRLIRSREILQEDFTINRSSDGQRSIVIPQGDYSYTEGLIGLDLADQRKLTARVTARWGEYYNGNRFQRNIQVNYRPNKYLSFGASYTENEIHLPAGNFTVRLINLNSQIAFSSTLSWSNLLQYDNVSESLGFNSRLNWVPEAGQEAFLVFNYGLADVDKDNEFESVSSDLSLKFTYTFRF